MNKKSFTIVELLVVMAVIGILITLAVVGIQALQKSQRELTRQTDLRNISAEMARFYGKYRRYPFISDEGTGEVLPCEKYFVILNPGFITNDYGYECHGDSTPPISPTSEFARIPLGIPGVGYSPGDWVGLGDIESSWKDFKCTDRSLTPGPDTWYILYGASFPYGTPAQSFILGACTEDGKTTNFGTRPDDVVNNY